MQGQATPLRILGIDPGTRLVGFALLEAKKVNPLNPRDWAVADAGVIRAHVDLSVSERLALIHEAMFDLMTEFSPNHVAIERAFHGKNAASSIKLGEARGVLIAAAGRYGVPILEFSPTQVKRTVGGSGAASKDDLAAALRSLLGFSRGVLPLDASDAVAIALTCSLGLRIPLAPAKQATGGRRQASDSYSKSK